MKFILILSLFVVTLNFSAHCNTTDGFSLYSMNIRPYPDSHHFVIWQDHRHSWQLHMKYLRTEIQKDLDKQMATSLKHTV